MKQLIQEIIIIIGGCLIGMAIIHYIASIPVIYVTINGDCIRVESPNLEDSCSNIPKTHLQIIGIK